MSIKKFTHCIKCPEFRNCNRKFDPGKEPIWSLIHNNEDAITLGNPIYCENPS